MCKQIYIATNGAVDRIIDGLFVVNGIKTPPSELAVERNEYAYQIVCGGMCACDFFDDGKKIHLNDLLRKKIRVINENATITKIYIYETDDTSFLTKEVTTDDIDNVLSEWRGNYLYKIKRDYKEYRKNGTL
ncbi:MAG: hypothetical protein LBT20_05230 [Clostridiales bacterium]|jgi:hypothetical protein|nr:hypothetical protein [Clostridiales bacterium]